MPLGVRSHGILLGSHRILLNRSSIQCRINRLEGAVQKQHWKWDLVGSLEIQLGSHTYAHAGSSIDAPGCGIPWDPTGIPQDPAQ